MLTQYGDIAEVWFDGANGEGPNGKRQVYDWPRVWGPTTDTGDPGDTAGDVLTFANDVFDAADTAKVGTDQGYCMPRRRRRRRYECNWTTFLAGGQIMVEGPFLDAEGQHARDHRRHRALPRRARRRWISTRCERHEVRVHVPPQGLSHVLDLRDEQLRVGVHRRVPVAGQLAQLAARQRGVRGARRARERRRGLRAEEEPRGRRHAARPAASGR